MITDGNNEQTLKPSVNVFYLSTHLLLLLRSMAFTMFTRFTLWAG
jgi:hypothetical protein